MPVQGIQIGKRTGFDDVRARAFTGHDAAGKFDADADFADRVLALGHTAHTKIHEATFGAGNAVHGLEHGIDRAVAGARIVRRFSLPGLEEADGSSRDDAGHHAEIIQFPDLGNLGELAFDNGANVFVVDRFLFIGERFHLVGDPADFVIAEFVAHLFELLADGVVAHVFAPREFAGPADVLGAHDFIRLAILHHAMLVDAGFMGERVLADDGFVALDEHPSHVADEPAGREELFGINAGLKAAKGVFAGLERHDDFFQRGIAGAFADAVEGAFNLAGAVDDGGERVGDG